ncbi:MAG TPA: presenilin family intramembrane aspartyl protease, partial [Methanocorpusculum sp.]|nr:presenilin family intramembrane aspartyl protease [Methanocorpusculum sp.]
MIGMGDVIMPAILVVSAQVFAGGVGIFSVFGLYLPAFGALIGGIIGLLILMVPVNTGKPQPGLPLINGCAILGFLICCLIIGSWGWLIL